MARAHSARKSVSFAGLAPDSPPRRQPIAEDEFRVEVGRRAEVQWKDKEGVLGNTKLF